MSQHLAEKEESIMQYWELAQQTVALTSRPNRMRVSERFGGGVGRLYMSVHRWHKYHSVDVLDPAAVNPRDRIVD